MSLEDKLYKFIKIYKNLPFPVKTFIGKIYRSIPVKFKYGSFYFTYLNRIRDRNINYDQMLKKHLELVVKKVPYYNQCKHKSILEFPIINKSTIRNDFESFLNPENKNFIKSNTGGSSGIPFEFYLESGISRPKEKAHFDWYWSNFGYKPGSRVLMIRGEALVSNKLYEYQSIENRLAISCYLIDKNNILKVVEVINNFKPEFIHAYPSALKNFINSVKESECTLKLKLKAIFLGSEGLMNKDREQIKSFFKTKIAHWYGHSERLIHAGNCPYSDEFHIFPFYGYSELIDDKNNVITEPNIKGRIVATGFDNSVMPLVRYDTGDEAEYSERQNCKCGFRGKSFKKIHGRGQDYIYLSNKTKVSLTAFIFGQHFAEFSAINELQLEQKDYGELLLRLVVKDDINKKKFISKLKSSVDNKLDINIEIVDSISKTKRGKHIFLIQKIED